MSKECLPNEVKEIKNKICVDPFQLLNIDAEDEEIVVKILNIFNENDYLVSEATNILEICIEALKHCPVVRYRK